MSLVNSNPASTRKCSHHSLDDAFKAFDKFSPKARRALADANNNYCSACLAHLAHNLPMLLYGIELNDAKSATYYSRLLEGPPR